MQKEKCHCLTYRNKPCRRSAIKNRSSEELPFCWQHKDKCPPERQIPIKRSKIPIQKRSQVVKKSLPKKESIIELPIEKTIIKTSPGKEIMARYRQFIEEVNTHTSNILATDIELSDFKREYRAVENKWYQNHEGKF